MSGARRALVSPRHPHPGRCPRRSAPAPDRAAPLRPPPSARGRAPRIPGPAAPGCGRCCDSGGDGGDRMKLPEGAGRFPAISGGGEDTESGSERLGAGRRCGRGSGPGVPPVRGSPASFVWADAQHPPRRPRTDVSRTSAWPQPRPPLPCLRGCSAPAASQPGGAAESPSEFLLPDFPARSTLDPASTPTRRLLHF